VSLLLPKANNTTSMKNYVLITAARNEGAYIELTLQSVTAQTVLPRKWVIVSDGSTDETDEIAERYSKKHNFIDFIRIDRQNHERNFASKVIAIREAYKHLQYIDYEYIGHLDADITFDDIHYYENMMNKFALNPELGIIGGFIYEKKKGEFESRPFNNVYSVAGGIQLFKRSCYEVIGGFLPLELGGEDWYAEVVARMKGWKVESFPELPVLHHKPTLHTRGRLSEGFRQGSMDYSLGSDPVFEIFKCLYRLKKNAHESTAFSRLCGYFWSFILRAERPVPVDFIRYLRKEQRNRLRTRFLSILFP